MSGRVGGVVYIFVVGGISFWILNVNASRALEGFGSAKTLLFWRSATCAQLAKAFAVGAVGFGCCSWAGSLGQSLSLCAGWKLLHADGDAASRLKAQKKFGFDTAMTKSGSSACVLQEVKL